MDIEQKNSILVVDDEVSNLQVLAHILGSAYTIYTAKNGACALEIAKKYMPDIILLDIIMPDMDGYQVLTELKNMEATEKIPVIFITGLSSTEDETKGLSLNAADYISKPFSPTIVKLRVRNQVKIVNQLRTIEHLSLVDQLTGIPNRRSFDERINAEWRRALRENRATPLSILVMDVDHFKIYNDTYGHQQGDLALQMVADIFSKQIKRSMDFAARWGGEEFIGLLPDTPLEGAMEIAENIRQSIENMEIPHDTNGASSKITVSIGVSTQKPSQNSWTDSFISMADKALYNAKTAGRNRVAYVNGDQ
ncbi:MAG: diguanylate cyclase [Treponema sp.]|nr:diguanylate cyclase [Treponema sp.]